MVKKTVRDQVYTLETYLKYVNDGDVCEDADVQRLAGNFDTREVNEIIYTTLTSDHIPEIILAECIEDNRTYIVDGLQRTTMLKLFRYGNWKITSSIDNPIVEYMKKKRDKNGDVVKNRRGQIEFEEAEINIRNKTYEMLPDELKKEFNDFQIRFVIHENCTKKRISELIKRYNYQRPMTSAQKAFTYINTYAVQARMISNKKLFTECSGYSEAEKINGTIERVVVESVMSVFHLDDWKKSSKSICEYLNVNSSEEEFASFGELVDRLGKVIIPDFNKIFTSKNSFIWFTLFYEFSKLGLEDRRFSDFMHEFNVGLKDRVVSDVIYKDIKDVTYSKLDKESGTKDKSLILAKIKTLEVLMCEFLHINEEDLKEVSTLNLVKESVNSNITEEDIEQYEDVLDILTLDVDNSSKLLDKHNRTSLVAIVAYSFENDINLDDWIVDYFGRNNTYIRNQRENFLHMKEDLKKYISNGRVA